MQFDRSPRQSVRKLPNDITKPLQTAHKTHRNTHSSPKEAAVI